MGEATWLIVGMGVCLLSAFLLAASMNIQSFALGCNDDARILNRVSRNCLWGVGILVYVLAQAVFIAALQLGPFAVMSALFTTVLLFDFWIAYCTVGKRPTKYEFAGLSIVFVAVCCCAVFSPKTEYQVTPQKLAEWSHTWGGITVLCVLGMLQLSGILLIHRFERRFPDFPPHGEKTASTMPQPWELELMRMIYPAVLALFETVGAAALKSMTSLMALLFGGSGGEGVAETISPKDVYSSPVFYIVFAVWFVCIWSVLYWLRVVYSKFKTTECLPAEIGMTTAFSIFTALLFFQEFALPDATPVRIALLAVNSLFVLLGILCMSLSDEIDPKTSAKNLQDYSRASLVQFGFKPPFRAESAWKKGFGQVVAANRFAQKPMYDKRARALTRGMARGGSVLVEIQQESTVL